MNNLSRINVESGITLPEKKIPPHHIFTIFYPAAIYIASIIADDCRTKQEIAEVSGVTEVTIRNRYQELAENLDIEIVL